METGHQFGYRQEQNIVEARAMTFVAATALLGLTLAVSASPPVQTYVEAHGPMGPLKGTMLSPATVEAPIVLIIPGSGPTDRDGNSPLGVKASSYRLLAEGLAAKGIATVRIDKRGLFASAGAVPDPNNVTLDDYVLDARSWIAAIRQVTGAKCVWLLGHSEGGVVALRTAMSAPDVCGLVLASTAGRSLGSVLREQLRANPANAPLLDQADAAITSLESGHRVDVSGLHPALQGLFSPSVQGFLISEISLDPAEMISAYSGRVLILQGGKDLQVSVMDAKRLEQADPRARVVVIPNANHVLKAINTDEHGANVASYADPDMPLAPGIIEAIADFIGPEKVR